MFLLFIFITLFLFLGGSEKISNSVLDVTDNKSLRSGIQFEMLRKDSLFVEKIRTSPLDTIKLEGPLFLAETYPDIIINLEIIEDSEDEYSDKWVAQVPHVLVEDGIVLLENDCRIMCLSHNCVPQSIPICQLDKGFCQCIAYKYILFFDRLCFADWNIFGFMLYHCKQMLIG